MEAAAAPGADAAGVLDDSERLTGNDIPCDFSLMPATLEQVTKEAMDLSPRQKLALAEFLLESAEATTDPEAEAARERGRQSSPGL